jgi:hypothetical protein
VSSFRERRRHTFTMPKASGYIRPGSGVSVDYLNFCTRQLTFSARKAVDLMRMNRLGRFAAAMVAVLWALTPSVACFLPTNAMTAAELECCHKMAFECGSSTMASSHTCCRRSPQPNTGISPVRSFSPMRHAGVAAVPLAAIVIVTPCSIARQLPALDLPLKGPSPGPSSILRI